MFSIKKQWNIFSYLCKFVNLKDDKYEIELVGLYKPGKGGAVWFEGATQSSPEICDLDPMKLRWSVHYAACQVLFASTVVKANA